MKPNDLPLICLPTELSDEAASQLIHFLYELTESLERLYDAQLINRHHRLNASKPPSLSDTHTDTEDPPF